METKKKQFKMPHTFVIIGIIILLAVLLTWIIPAGSYTRFENEAGIKVIDPNDFNYIDKTPVNPLEIPLYIVKAFIKRIYLMLVIMFAGGAFHILTKTGALHAVVAKMAKIFSTRVYLFLPILTLVFGLICTTQGVNLFIAFAPIMVMMAFAMGLDSITGASIILLGGAIGAFITYTVIRSMDTLGPARAVMLIVIAQLLVAYVIELLGLFGVEKQPLEWRKVIGMGMAIVGVIIFKWN